MHHQDSDERSHEKKSSSCGGGHRWLKPRKQNEIKRIASEGDANPNQGRAQNEQKSAPSCLGAKSLAEAHGKIYERNSNAPIRAPALIDNTQAARG